MNLVPSAPPSLPRTGLFTEGTYCHCSQPRREFYETVPAEDLDFRALPMPGGYMPAGISLFYKVAFSMMKVIFSSYICQRQRDVMDECIGDGFKQGSFKSLLLPAQPEL